MRGRQNQIALGMRWTTCPAVMKLGLRSKLWLKLCRTHFEIKIPPLLTPEHAQTVSFLKWSQLKRPRFIRKWRTIPHFKIYRWYQLEVITSRSDRQKNLIDDVVFQFLLMSAKMVSGLQNTQGSCGLKDDIISQHL